MVISLCKAEKWWYGTTYWLRGKDLIPCQIVYVNAMVFRLLVDLVILMKHWKIGISGDDEVLTVVL